MSEPGDLQAPPWLAQNWRPKEPFDPTPWLQERYKRNIEAQKLPLELQGMELQNKAQQLAIEHQGIQNDLANQEMDAFAEDLPKLRSYLETVSKTPGGSLDVPPPAFRSTKAIQSVLQRQKMDADTILGKTIMEDQIAATKQAAQLRQIGIDPTPAYVNGRWDSSLLSDMGIKATEDANIREANLIQQRNAHYADKNLVEASRIAELKSQIDAAQSVISSSPSPVMTPEKKAAIDTATKAKYELDALQTAHGQAGHTPAAVATFEFRQSLKQQIADAEDAGDFAKADTLSEGLRRMDSEHPDLREKARYQSIVSSLRNVERQLGDLTMKNKWPELEARKSELQKQLESSASAPPTTQNSAINKAYIWTPKGAVLK